MCSHPARQNVLCSCLVSLHTCHFSPLKKTEVCWQWQLCKCLMQAFPWLLKYFDFVDKMLGCFASRQAAELALFGVM